jgi:allophanate hydrolase subunit 2
MLVAHHINAMQYVAFTNDDRQTFWLENWQVFLLCQQLAHL